MKKCLIVPIMLICVVISCTKNAETPVKKKSTPDESPYLKIEAKVTSNPFRLVSDQLKEVKAINKFTGDTVTGFVPVPVTPEYEQMIEYGYFLYGRCFVYGTMYNGNNGISLFVPCGINCVGLDPICPDDEDGWYTRKGERTVELKFEK
ncbi:hypothetical protein DVR12_02265 [Chitinophaga silvatica]|uniref:Lipoprotein n=1 Tax=Chitinophaga silvatica TaxID=2282649 RepID=A0A3E1YH01_9BACT|nr:hypothetical protein [Chitinophaga silvatica]RFS26634.1 hypothetical protein DVR12_02265 [Chitinophaga silvatica]